MSGSPVAYIATDDVAVIRIDHPPVNALSHAVRSGMLDALHAADADTRIRAVVIACAGRTFVAGADIKEFGGPRLPPTLTDLIAALDAMAKPVVAALHGTVLGGGLELALACHGRVAIASTRLGLPEVKLGLIPGAGGTQLLPRAIGAIPALRMIAGGEPVAAAEALEAGLIDQMIEGDVQEAATGFARLMAEQGCLRRLRHNDAKLEADREDPARFDAAAAEVGKRAPGGLAALAAVDAVRGALELPFDDGLRRERALFDELVAGDQSRAQRHLFFAEREAARLDPAMADRKLESLRQAAVIGAGTMGSGIAMCFADAGIPVALIEADQQALERGLSLIRTMYEGAAKRGRIAGDDAVRRIALVNGSTACMQAAEADVIVEAVFEDLEVKLGVFAELDRIAGQDAVLATNTSYLDIDQIAAGTSRPAIVVGLHFFSPANVMRLVEVVRGRATAPETVATAVSLARRLGKIPVVVGNCHGFVGNRMLRQRNVAAERLLLAGALPQEIDAAMTEFGFAMGPLAATDLAGLDIGWRMRKAQGLRAEIADALCELGRFGQKAGGGFYRYAAGSRAPLPDPEVEALILESSRSRGIVRRSFAPAEIVEHLILPMINEGARILDEGIAARPGDIDVIWAHGYGWPVWRGGPMYYADTIGLPFVRERLRRLAAESGDESLNPAPLVERLAADGLGFGSLRSGSPLLRSGSPQQG